MPAALTRRSALAAAVALITCCAAPVAAAPIYARDPPGRGCRRRRPQAAFARELLAMVEQ